MKIVSLQAENIKRLRAVEITPSGNLVEITGRNGQGKTSVLDAIWWALAGTKPIQSEPIRKGADTGYVTLNLGDYVVHRSFKRKEGGGEYTTQLSVETPDGARLRSPQTLLDGFLGTLTVDPLAFARMDARAQFDALRAFVPGVDFNKIAGQDRGDYARRTELNRMAREKRAAAASIEVPTDFVPIDEQALVDQLTDAAGENDRLAERKRRRDAIRHEIADAEAAIAGCDVELGIMRDRFAKKEAERASLVAKVEADRERLASAPALPDPVNVDDLRTQIASAREHNAKGARAGEREKLLTEAGALETDARALTIMMATREAAKRDAIAAAKLPVDGLEFGDGHIRLNGQPFEQASDAERLRASVAIAMASAPTLRVIRVRDGSLLDSTAIGILAKMADVADCQVWIETVSDGDRAGFVIEDGSVVAPTMKAAE